MEEEQGISSPPGTSGHQLSASSCIHAEPTSLHAILQHLRLRYEAKRIYTELKPNFLLRLHPYEDVNIYSDEFIRLYSRLDSLEPHLFRLCLWCHWRAYEIVSQAIIISGISGSGKTETFWNILRFLRRRTNSPLVEHVIQIQQLLKAFGSSCTQKSASSTRFGQLLDLHLDFKGDVVQAFLTHLLLEKRRITQRSRRGQERNFDIFYYLLSGAELQLLKSLRLQRNRQNYAVLRLCSEQSADDSQEAKSKFAQIKHCLEWMQLDEPTIFNVFQILAIILKAGNLSFKPSLNLDNTPSCIVQSEHDFCDLSNLLGCDSSALSSAFLRKTVHLRGENVSMDLCAEEAQANVDLFLRTLYSRLFHWLVGRTNEALRIVSRDAGAANRILSLVDTYGFDDLEVNTFEQLLINAVNERMHWFLVDQNLRREQELYVQENLSWTWVSFEDQSSETLNALCLCFSSLDLRPVLNTPPPVSGDFLEIIAEKITPSPDQRLRVLSKTDFLVRHYFTDILKRDICDVLFHSSNNLCRILFPEGDVGWSTLTKRLSTAAQFQVSLNSVFRSLTERECSWIVCIKPNSLEKAGLIEEEYVTEQLRAFNVLEVSCLGQAGYASSQDYQTWLNRYRFLSRAVWPRWRGPPREGVVRLLKSLDLSPTRYCLGRNRLFLKDLSLIAHLESRRQAELHRLATMIQTVFRYWYRTHRGGYYVHCQTVITAWWRGYRARREYLSMRKSCILIQAYARGWLARKLCRRLRREKAGLKIARSLLKYYACHYLQCRAKSLPSMSPIDRFWPRVSCQRLFAKTDDLIRLTFHRWRCSRYRANMDQQEYFRMREKLTASVLLKDRKLGYDMTRGEETQCMFSVGHPFRGDYVKIRQNPKWRKIAVETNDEYVVFADCIAKIHRASGKVSSTLLVLSTAGIVLLDTRSLQLKQRAPVQAVTRISLSPFCDSVAVFHLRDAALSKNPGDFILECRHMVELVAKLYLVVQNATGKPPAVDISSNIWVACEDEPLELVFKPMPDEDSGVFHKGCFLTGSHKPPPPSGLPSSQTMAPGTQKHPHPKPSISSPFLGCYETAEQSEADGAALREGSPGQQAIPHAVRYMRKSGRLEVHF